jgi:hypothetical protein
MKIFLVLLLLFSSTSLFSLERKMRLKMKNEPKVALVVGNSSFPKSKYFADLDNPKNDVKAVAKKLRKLGFKVLEGYNLSDLELQEKLDHFYSLLKSKKEGVGLFYFAGHGIEVNGINYLIPSDISVKDAKYVPYRSTPLNPIVESMNKTGKRLNIAVLDACRENPFTSRGNNKRGGLAPFSASGTFIAYSAESGKFAEDGTGQTLSPFAKAFVKHIEKPQKIEEFFKDVRVDVYKDTDGEQTPVTQNLIRGDFYFKLPSEEELISAGGVSGETTFTSSNEEREEFFLTVLNNVSNFRIKVDGDYFQNGDLLKRGKYRVEVLKSGYKTVQKNITISKDTKFRVKMEKSKVSLTVNPDPRDSRIYIMNIVPKYRDGILLERGKYDLKIKKSGYYTKRLTVNLQSDSNFNVKLDRIGGNSSNSQAVSQSQVSKGKWDKRIYRGQRSYSKFSRNLVKDNFTNLVWTKNSSPNSMNWNSAKRYCQNLSVDGYSDFRLPTIEELYYLSDRSKREPAVDTKYFNIKSRWHWSDNIIKSYDSRSWVVYFSSGNGSWDNQTSSYFAVCVRDL